MDYQPPMRSEALPAETIDLLRRMERTVAEEMLDEVDLARLLELDPAKQEMARRRLAVVGAYMGQDRSAIFDDFEAAARAADVSRSTFFALVGAWRKDEPYPLGALGLYLSRRTGSPRSVETKASQVSSEAVELLSQRPGLRTSELVRLLGGGSGAGMAATTLFRIVDDARPLVPSRKPFGTLVRLDAASLDLSDEEGRRQRLHAVVDVGTGLVCGWKVGPEGGFVEGYSDAVAMACASDPSWTRAIGRWGLLTTSSPGVVEVAVPKDADADVLRSMAAQAGWRVLSDPRRAGRAIIEAVGRSLDSIGLSAGFAPPGVAHRSRAAKGLDLVGPLSLARIDRALAEHDARRVRLTRAGSTEYQQVLREALGPMLELAKRS